MKSWEEIADEWAFTIRGKKYVIPDLPYTAMLKMQKVKAGEATDLDGMSAEDSWRLIMGPAWDEMVADDVPAEAISRAGLATLSYFEHGREVAEAIWEKGIDPKALAAAILARAEPSAPSGTDAESATPSPATTSGTSSRRTSSARSRASKAKPSQS